MLSKYACVWVVVWMTHVVWYEWVTSHEWLTYVTGMTHWRHMKYEQSFMSHEMWVIHVTWLIRITRHESFSSEDRRHMKYEESRRIVQTAHVTRMTHVTWITMSHVPSYEWLTSRVMNESRRTNDSLHMDDTKNWAAHVFTPHERLT